MIRNLRIELVAQSNRPTELNLSALSKSLWTQIKQVKLALHHEERKVASMPAVYGILASSIFPVAMIATLYSLTMADIKLSISQENQKKPL